MPYINLAIVVGAYRGMGYGEAVGAMIQNESLTIPTADELREFIKENLTTNPAQAAAAADLLQTITTLCADNRAFLTALRGVLEGGGS